MYRGLDFSPRFFLVGLALLSVVTVHQIVQLDSLASNLDMKAAKVKAMESGLEVRTYYRNREKVRELALYAFQVEGLDWGDEEADAMAEIAWRESRFLPTSKNPESTSYGLYGFLDGTWKKIDKTDDPLLQTIAATRYIKHRYGTPQSALKFWDEGRVVNGKVVHYY